MAMLSAIPVEFGFVFPHGAYVKGGVEPVRDFDRSQAGRFVQATDKTTGVRLWQVEVIDADPESRGSVKVKIAAEVQPVLPAAPGGLPFVPVEFEALTVTPYVNGNNGRLAYSFKATGMHSPKTGGRPVPAKDTGRDSGRDAAKDAA
jgi:hypothetical protein